MIALCNIRPKPEYRRDAFEAGLRRLGYAVTIAGDPKDERDLLVLWNRQGPEQELARNWEMKGGTVIVCENGYIGQDSQGRPNYAIAVGGHNGSGWFPVEQDDRFTPLGIDLKPWQKKGMHLLVCGQRGVGSTTMASPQGWEDRTAVQLRGMGFKVRIRRHPGRFPAPVSLTDELRGAEACVVWSSASGVRALIEGVPVVYAAPHWICEGAATRWAERMGELKRDDDARHAAFMRMAHAQWSVAEIEAGEPFARILRKLAA